MQELHTTPWARVLTMFSVLFLVLAGAATSNESVSAAPPAIVTPPATTIAPSTTDAALPDTFDLSGFGIDPLLVSVSLSGASGTTFSLPSTTGLTPSYGYGSWTGITELNFTGTEADANAALDAMTVSTGATTGAVALTITATRDETNVYYLAATGHYYQSVQTNAGYAAAKADAQSRVLKGRPGYLVTIGSAAEQDFVTAKIGDAANIWIGATDGTVEGRWDWDGGPESGDRFWQASCVDSDGAASMCPDIDAYPPDGGTDIGSSNWCGGEPNNADGTVGEDHAVTNWSGGTCWNDLNENNTGEISGYVVEYGDSQMFTGVASASMSITVGAADAAAAVTSVSSTALNGVYGAGATIPVVVNFNRAVDVTGTPTLTLETGATDRVATYSAGSGTASLQFDYAVQEGDSTADLDYVATSSLALAGGTITYGVGPLDAALTLPTPGSTFSLGGQKNLAIDAPVVVTTTTEAPTTTNEPTTTSTPVTETPPGEVVVTVDGVPQTASVSTTANGMVITTSEFTWQLSFADPAGQASVVGGVMRLREGGLLQLRGADAQPNSPLQVWLHSTPVLLGTMQAGGDGTFSGAMRVGSAAAGTHTVHIDAVSAAGVVQVDVGVQYVAGSTPLPTTGSNGTATAMLALSLTCLGGALVLTARRRLAD